MPHDPYPIQPWSAPCRGEVKVPGSKSLTNRALIIAALCDGPVRMNGALFSRDTRILTENLTVLGFETRSDSADSVIEVVGQGGRIPNAEARLFVGNAGTAARFLTAFVCLHPDGHYYMDGDVEMRGRPMGGLIEALEALGARFVFHGEKGCFPFDVKTAGLSGGEWEVDAGASSQMLSALMMVAPFAAGNVDIKATGARPAFVKMTAGLMSQFGIQIEGSPESGYQVSGQQSYIAPASEGFDIEPDATAASYFMILPAVVGGSIHIAGLGDEMLQGDITFASVLESLGLVIEKGPTGWQVQAGSVNGPESAEFEFTTFSDTFLTLAAVAPLLPFPIRMMGIGHTRYQETDRIKAMATELQRIGVAVEEEETALAVHPFPESFQPKAPVTIQTYKDHRVAMSFGILGCSPRFGTDQPWLQIADPDCCGKTFPGFFEKLDQLHRRSHDK